jgi:cold-inducible RNA-binding protein
MHNRALLLGCIGGSHKEGAVSVRLFIGNLPYAANEPELREHLSSVGEPSQIVLPVDRETGRPRGFAFVDYADRAVAEEAIRRFNQQPFKGRPLAVSEARPREDRPPGPRPGGFSSGGSFSSGGARPTGPGGSGGGGGGGFAPRPGGYSPRPSSDTGAGGGARSRNFGPDAPPKNKRKPPRKDDRGPKGPIKARPVTTLYDNDEDWRADGEPEIDDVATSKASDDALDPDVDVDIDNGGDE